LRLIDNDIKFNVLNQIRKEIYDVKI
jgi:hypothetical protein